MELVDEREPGECWPWLGKIANGYGRWAPQGRYQFAHRVAYIIAHGEIPEGLVIDHVRARGCLRTDCVNPAHLEAVTNTENLRRGMSPSMIAHRDNRCRNGHELVGDNVIVGSRSNRQCRICRNEWARKRAYTKNPDIIPRDAPHCRNGHPRGPGSRYADGRCKSCVQAAKQRASSGSPVRSSSGRPRSAGP